MKNTRKILALVLVLMMVLPMFTMFTVSAATPATLYLQPGTNWKSNNTWFAAYFFGNGEKWVKMTDTDNDGIYEVAVPAGYPNVIFCRMNPASSSLAWGSKWDQTVDIVIPTNGNDLYTIPNTAWNNATGSWSKYIPPQQGHVCVTVEDKSKYVAPTCTTEGLKVEDCTAEGCENPHRETTIPALGHKYTNNICTVCGEAATYRLVGNQGLCNGVDWGLSADVNKMTRDPETGIYSIVVDNVAAGTYSYKVARDGVWDDGQYPASGQPDASVTVSTAGSVKVVWDPAKKSLTAEAHAHTFVEGKCSCGAEDPTYVPVHVNALAVGDTNKIIIDADHGAYDNGYGYPTVTLPFVVTEAAHYKFAAEGVTVVIADSTPAIISTTGEANLKAGLYYISLAFNDASTGECNVAVTQSAWVNSLVLGASSDILVTDLINNGAGYFVTWVPFNVTEEANYAFTGTNADAIAWIFTADCTTLLCGMTGAADLQPGDYMICVAPLAKETTGVFGITVTKTAIGGGDPVDPPVETPTHDGEQEFVVGENTVIIDGCTLNAANSPIEMVKFVVTKTAKYTFVSDINTYITTSNNPSDFGAYLGGALVEEGILKPGTYYLCCGNNGALGEFAVTVVMTAIDPATCEHEWIAATCAAPKTCSNCGTTEGEVDPSAHSVYFDTCIACGKDLPSFKLGVNHVVHNSETEANDIYVKIEITEPGKYVVRGGAPVKVYMWSVPTSQLVDGQLTLDTPYRWNVDTDSETGFADSFEIDLPEAGVYWIGFNYDFAKGEVEFDVEIAPYEEPAPQSFFDMILAWIMSFIQMILGWFKF